MADEIPLTACVFPEQVNEVAYRMQEVMNRHLSDHFDGTFESALRTAFAMHLAIVVVTAAQCEALGKLVDEATGDLADCFSASLKRTLRDGGTSEESIRLALECVSSIRMTISETQGRPQ